MGRKIMIWAVLVLSLLILLNSMVGISSAQEKSVPEKGEKAIIWIYNVYDLQNMSKDLNGNYALANDIDATITKTWNGDAGFVPIGNENAPFNGTFDGRGHKIINLWINRSSQDYVGLFGYTTKNTVIENVGLVNVSVSGNYFVGGLVGLNDGMVNNSYVTGSVSGNHGVVGGLVGINSGTVNNSYSTGNVTGSDDVGGLVGLNYYGTVSNSYATGNVSGWNSLGGLVGDNYGVLRNSHYDVDKVLINGRHYLTIGGIFDSQYNDWISHNLTLDISNYPSLVPDGDYYDISDIQGIKDMLGFCEDGYKFKLITDIDLSSEHNLYIPYFDGVFDGNNHTISNLSVQISFASETGLFGFKRGTIRNIATLNVNVSGDHYVGGLVGRNYGTVSNSYATGSVSGNEYVGGLAGGNDGTVSNSYATGSVSASWDSAGGLVGRNDGTVSNSYATGSVSGDWYVGGLVGLNYYGTVNNSYATGSVSGNNYVGGLVGENNGGTVTASFWDVNTLGISTSDGGTGLTTLEMKNKTTFLNAGWDFTNIWDIVDGQTYPFFKWQKPSKPSAPLYLHAIAGDGFVNLTWTNPSFDGASPITEYRIYRDGVLIKIIPASQLWFNDTKVNNGQTYTYYVTAVNAAGESPKSNEVQATPGGTIPEITPGAIIIVALLSLMTALRKRKN